MKKIFVLLLILAILLVLIFVEHRRDIYYFRGGGPFCEDIEDYNEDYNITDDKIYTNKFYYIIDCSFSKVEVNMSNRDNRMYVGVMARKNVTVTHAIRLRNCTDKRANKADFLYYTDKGNLLECHFLWVD